jgi:hypothetical protein
MTGALPPGGQAPGAHGGGTQPSGNPYDARDLFWSRDFERDRSSGLVTLDRAVRVRDISRTDLFDEQVADEVIDELLARIDGRRTPSRS